ncbi:hypothetical protein [Aegicerativicinus sediminis]
MRIITLLISFIFFTHIEVTAQTEFLIEPSQSMIMTGKGTGQDATINPYFGEDCYALVENIGNRQFSIRIQQDGKILKEIPIKKGELKKVKLLRGHELYLDPNPEGIAKARVDYEELNE